ncbi:MAG: MBL fold metallo-hydrolase, partial [Crocinitomicaceae bacterium]|nr:MBL fold metallo-hydrolase [Crocinitomicaceae bacterium]
MKLHVLNTGFFKLDGGAMFGVVPKTMWQKTNPADENNMCSWAMRSLLIEDGNRLILIDTGIGDKQSEKFFSHYYMYGNDSLHGNLAKLGFHTNDITDVFLTHLHFDHCGGAINWTESKDGYRPAFPNATYWSTENHWKWATEPNPREKASFLAENILPIQESGQLKFIERTGDFTKNAFPNLDVLFVDGHT